MSARVQRRSQRDDLRLSAFHAALTSISRDVTVDVYGVTQTLIHIHTLHIDTMAGTAQGRCRRATCPWCELWFVCCLFTRWFTFTAA